MREAAKRELHASQNVQLPAARVHHDGSSSTGAGAAFVELLIALLG